jgi:superfamily II DNA helicase RecQ
VIKKICTSPPLGTDEFKKMLLVKIMTLSFDQFRGGFDESLLKDFLKSHMILSVKDHFFAKNEQQYLTLVMTYSPAAGGGDVEVRHNSKDKTDESWKELITEADMGIFNLLREWRGKRSKIEGVPPYILFTNRQLALIVKTKPQSLSELQKIDGIGESKTKKYGSYVLSITKVEGPAAVLSSPQLTNQEQTNDGRDDQSE